MPRERQRRVWKDLMPVDLEEVRELWKRQREFIIRRLKETYAGTSLEEIVAKEGITIKIGGLKGQTMGKYCQWYRGLRQPVILLADGLTPNDRQETLAHELVHHFLHGPDKLVTDGQGHLRKKRLYPEAESEAEAEELIEFMISLSNQQGGQTGRSRCSAPSSRG